MISRNKDAVYWECMEQLKEQGVEGVTFSDILPEDRTYLENYFMESILLLLSPQVIGKKQPFPFLKNKEIYAVVVLGSKSSEKLGIIPCSNNVFARMVAVPSAKNRYILVEVAAPILDADVRERITGMFNLILRDNVKARFFKADGSYIHPQSTDVQLNAQEYFYALVYQSAGEP